MEETKKTTSELKNKFAKLIEVKSIISMVAAFVFGYLSIQGKLDVKDIMVLLTMVFQSFFSYQSNKKGDDKNA